MPQILVKTVFGGELGLNLDGAVNGLLNVEDYGRLNDYYK
jgi:hypothetical protein